MVTIGSESDEARWRTNPIVVFSLKKAKIDREKNLKNKKWKKQTSH